MRWLIDHCEEDNSSGYDMDHVLTMFADGECSNPLDRVYGLLGIVKDDELIEVDYTLMTEQLLDKLILAEVDRRLDRTPIIDWMKLECDSQYFFGLKMLARSWGLDDADYSSRRVSLWKGRRDQRLKEAGFRLDEEGHLQALDTPHHHRDLNGEGDFQALDTTHHHSST